MPGRLLQGFLFQKLPCGHSCSASIGSCKSKIKRPQHLLYFYAVARAMTCDYFFKASLSDPAFYWPKKAAFGS